MMDIERKKKLYNFLIIIFLYIGLSCIPFSLFIKDNILVIGLQSIIQILFLVGLILFLLKPNKKIFEKNIINKKNILLLLPTFIVCFSNYFVLISGFSFVNNIDGIKILFLIILNIILVANEELIFRLLGFDEFKNKNSFLKILFTSLIFSISHISSFLSTFNPVDLIVIGYTLALGILLGIFYEFGGSLKMCYLLHLLFNLFNSIIFENIFVYSSLTIFIIVNIIITFIITFYLIILFLLQKIKPVDQMLS